MDGLCHTQARRSFRVMAMVVNDALPCDQLALAWLHLTDGPRGPYGRLSSDKTRAHPIDARFPLVRASVQAVVVAYRHEGPDGACELSFSAERPLGFTASVPLTLPYPMTQAGNLRTLLKHETVAFALAA